VLIDRHRTAIISRGAPAVAASSAGDSPGRQGAALVCADHGRQWGVSRRVEPPKVQAARSAHERGPAGFELAAAGNNDHIKLLLWLLCGPGRIRALKPGHTPSGRKAACPVEPAAVSSSKRSTTHNPAAHGGQACAVFLVPHSTRSKAVGVGAGVHEPARLAGGPCGAPPRQGPAQRACAAPRLGPHRVEPVGMIFGRVIHAHQHPHSPKTSKTE
jgi:hypothetical protein